MPGWRWLASTITLQKESYGVSHPLEGEELAEYVTFNLLALHSEVSEVGREVDWKPWSKGRGRFDKQRILEELVDVMHFVGNLAVAVDITDEEMWTEYRRKQEENRQRQVTNYVAAIGVENGFTTPVTVPRTPPAPPPPPPVPWTAPAPETVVAPRPPDLLADERNGDGSWD